MKVGFTINSIISNETHVILVLRENTPWTSKNVDEECERIQKRILGCINLAADGILAEKHPDTKGKFVIIRLECDGPSRSDVDDILEYLNDYLFVKEEYRKDLMKNQYFESIQIEALYKTKKP